MLPWTLASNAPGVFQYNFNKSMKDTFFFNYYFSQGRVCLWQVQTSSLSWFLQQQEQGYSVEMKCKFHSSVAQDWYLFFKSSGCNGKQIKYANPLFKEFKILVK